MHHNFLVIKEENFNSEDTSYELQMLQHNKMNGIIPVTVQKINYERFYYYDITSKQSLKTILQTKQLNYHEVKSLVNGIIVIIEASREYLLNENNFILDPEYVYINYSNHDVYLCYKVGYQKYIREQVKVLMEELINQVDYKDEKAVLLIYSLYKKSTEDTCTFIDLKNIIVESEKHHKKEIPEFNSFESTNENILDETAIHRNTIDKDVKNKSIDNENLGDWNNSAKEKKDYSVIATEEITSGRISGSGTYKGETTKSISNKGASDKGATNKGASDKRPINKRVTNKRATNKSAANKILTNKYIKNIIEIDKNSKTNKSSKKNSTIDKNTTTNRNAIINKNTAVKDQIGKRLLTKNAAENKVVNNLTRNKVIANNPVNEYTTFKNTISENTLKNTIAKNTLGINTVEQDHSIKNSKHTKLSSSSYAHNKNNKLENKKKSSFINIRDKYAINRDIDISTKEGNESNCIKPPLMAERLHTEQEIEYYSIQTKLIGGFSVIVTIILFFLISRSNLILNEIGNKVDSTKLIGVIIILLSLEVYSLSKIFNPEKKNTQMLSKINYIDWNSPNCNSYSQNEEDSVSESNCLMSESHQVDGGFIKEPSLEQREIIQEKKVDFFEVDTEETILLSDLREDGYYFVSKYNHEYSTIEIIDFPFFIGKLKANLGYTIEHEAVSRFHLKIDKEEDKFYITDLNSKNGTLLNGLKLIPNNKYDLKIDDEVTIAHIGYSFTNKQ